MKNMFKFIMFHIYLIFTLFLNGLEGMNLTETINHTKEDENLLIAVEKGFLEKVGKLLNKGANPNVQDKFGNTSLIKLFMNPENAKDKDIFATVELLLEKGADPNLVNMNNDTPLIIAAMMLGPIVFKNIIKILLEYGADPYIGLGYKEYLLWIKDNPDMKDIRKNPPLPKRLPNLFQNFFLQLLKNTPEEEVKKEIIEIRKLGEPKKVINVINNYSKENQERIWIWIFTGFINKATTIKDFCEKIKITFEEKTGFKNFQQDLFDAVRNFTIFTSEGTKIICNKSILKIRSGLFKGMFATIKEGGDSVTDGLGISKKTLKNLYYLMCTGELKSDLTKEQLKELSDVADFYQLDEKEVEKINKRIKEMK